MYIIVHRYYIGPAIEVWSLKFEAFTTKQFLFGKTFVKWKRNWNLELILNFSILVCNKKKKTQFFLKVTKQYWEFVKLFCSGWQHYLLFSATCSSECFLLQSNSITDFMSHWQTFRFDLISWHTFCFVLSKSIFLEQTNKTSFTCR